MIRSIARSSTASVMVALIAGLLFEACWANDVISKNGDTIVVDGTTYRLDGVDAPEIDQACLDGKGAAWPCRTYGRERQDQYIAANDNHQHGRVSQMNAGRVDLGGGRSPGRRAQAL